MSFIFVGFRLKRLCLFLKIYSRIPKYFNFIFTRHNYTVVLHVTLTVMDEIRRSCCKLLGYARKMSVLAIDIRFYFPIWTRDRLHARSMPSFYLNNV